MKVIEAYNIGGVVDLGLGSRDECKDCKERETLFHDVKFWGYFYSWIICRVLVFWEKASSVPCHSVPLVQLGWSLTRIIFKEIASGTCGFECPLVLSIEACLLVSPMRFICKATAKRIPRRMALARHLPAGQTKQDTKGRCHRPKGGNLLHGGGTQFQEAGRSHEQAGRQGRRQAAVGFEDQQENGAQEQ